MTRVLAGVAITCSALALIVSAFSWVFSSAAGNYWAGNLDAWSCRVFEASERVVERLSQPRRGRL